jgi:hypothetical protein
LLLLRLVAIIKYAEAAPSHKPLKKNTLLFSRVFFLLRHLCKSCADNQKANAEKNEVHN